MKAITPETTVGELVRATPARSRIFENLGIDYCCGGKKPLAEVCRGQGLDPATVFETFNAAMTTHTGEEEAVVFPKIRQLETTNGDKAGAAAELKAVFAKLESEHENAGAALERFKELTDDYTPPEWACNTFRALYDGLRQLEKNMHQHVHKENNVLFVKALAAA